AYRRSPRTYWFGLSVAAALGCGAIYLPGLVFLLSFVVLWIALLARRGPTRWTPLLVVAGTLAVVATLATFGPYLAAVDVFALQPATSRGVFKRLLNGAYSVVAGPVGAVDLAAGRTIIALTPGPDFGGLGRIIALAGAALWVQAGSTIALWTRALARGR